jgi:hypothetical protein
VLLRKEVCYDVMIAFEMLGGKAMDAVEKDGGEMAGDHLNGLVAHRCWFDAAGAVNPAEG